MNKNPPNNERTCSGKNTILQKQQQTHQDHGKSSSEPFPLPIPACVGVWNWPYCQWNILLASLLLVTQPSWEAFVEIKIHLLNDNTLRWMLANSLYKILKILLKFQSRCFRTSRIYWRNVYVRMTLIFENRPESRYCWDKDLVVQW